MEEKVYRTELTPLSFLQPLLLSTSGDNLSGYSNPAYDALIDTYFVTIPRPARMEVLRQIVHQFSDQLILLPLAYTTNHVAVSKKLKNITGRGANNTEGWNAEKWEYTP